MVAFIKLPVIVAPLTVPVTVAFVLTISALTVEVPVVSKLSNVVVPETVKLSCTMTLPLIVPPVLGR